MSKILESQKVLKDIHESTLQYMERCEFTGRKKFTIISVGNDPGCESYVNMKLAKAKVYGIEATHAKFDTEKLDDRAIYFEILELINKCNMEGTPVMLQLPLLFTKHNRQALTSQLIGRIGKHVDADGLLAKNIDYYEKELRRTMITNYSMMRPCTPAGIIALLQENNYGGLWLRGKHALVIGRSDLLGTPLARYLKDRDATVTVANSSTSRNLLVKLIKCSDIVFSCVGKRFDIEPSIFSGKILVDTGFNRDEQGRIVGDMPIDAHKYTMAHTPSTKCIGPITVAMLMMSVAKLNSDINTEM